MINTELRFVELLEAEHYAELQHALNEGLFYDVAEFIAELDPEKAAVCFALLEKDLAAEVFAEMEGEIRTHLIAALTDQEVQALIENLYLDDAVDLVQELPASVVPRVLRAATPATRKRLNQFLNYPENSAGSVMTPEFVRLKKNWTVAFSIERIRRDSEDAASIMTLFVTDERRVLEGLLSIRQLLTAADDQLVGDIMDDHFVSIKVLEDQEVAIRLFRDHDLVDLPVVDGENRLVGLITVDDVFDASEAEVTEDFEKMAAVNPTSKPYLKMSVWEHARNRAGWLMILLITGMLTGSVLAAYEHAYLAIPILVTFIPMLTDTGGNAGSQSSTMVIRGLALGEIEFKDVWKVIWKELRVSLIAGVCLAAVNFLRIYFMLGTDVLTAIVVSLAIVVIVMLSKVVGGSLPLIAARIGLDPAIMAAPLITTIVDVVGLFVYFQIASLILGI